MARFAHERCSSEEWRTISGAIDGQGTARFCGYVALTRLGIIEKHPRGELVLGATRVRYAFGGVGVADDILAAYKGMRFSLTDDDDYISAFHARPLRTMS